MFFYQRDWQLHLVLWEVDRGQFVGFQQVIINSRCCQYADTVLNFFIRFKTVMRGEKLTYSKRHILTTIVVV